MAELRYTYLLDVKDMASRQVAQANARIAGAVDRANAAMARQGTVAENSARKVQTAGARQAAEWKQVQRAALSADRAVAQAATQSAQTVSRSVERQVAALRKQNQSYAQIARAQKAAGVSSRETAAAVEQAKARELRAYESTAAGAARSTGRVRGMLRGQLQQVKSFATGMVAAFGVFKAAQFVGDSVKQVGELARGTVKLSAVTGMDARTASQWLVIAKQRGLAARQLNQSFITLERNQVKGAAGTKLQAAAFEKLGITQADLKKLGTEQLIERVADGFQRLGPGAQRAALAQQLFARGGQSLIATLAGGGQRIRDMRRIVDEYGASLDAKGVKNAMRLVTAQRQLNLAMLGIKVSLGQALIPLLAKGAQALSTFILQIRQGKGPGGDFRKVVEGMAAGARDVVAFVKPAVAALAGFVRQHPGVVKVAGAIVAVGVAARAIRFVGALTGATRLLGVLRQVAAVKFGGMAGGAAAGAAGRAAAGAGGGGVAGLLSRLGLGRVSSLAKVAGGAITIPLVVAAAISIVDRRKTRSQQLLKDLDAVQATARQKVERINQEIAKVGDRPHAVTGGRTRRVNPLLNVEQDLKASLPALRAQAAKMDLASAFAAQAAKVRGVMGSLSQRTIQQLAKMRGPLRAQAAQAVVDVTRAMEGMGVKPVGSARKLAAGIQSVLGDMHLQAGRLSRATVRSVIASFGGLANALDGPFRHAQAKFLTFLRNMQSTADRVKNVANLTGLPGQGARRRKGGWNFAAGGFVPAMVSPGELIVHGNAGMVVPGHPVAADTVPMLLPTGSAVLTGHGQQLLAQGATISQAVAAQAPHFRTGGHVRGRVSWFGGPHDSQDSGRTALGLTTATPGVAIRPGDTWQTGRPTLGQYWRVRLRNGRSAVLRQTDLGPNQSTGRRIDLTYSALSRFGYREGNFPTDSIGVADLVGKGAAAGGAGTPGYSYRVSGLAQAQARRVGPSRTRQGLVSDAYQQGFDQGVAGLTRSRLAREPDTAYRAIAGAYRLPAARTVNVPGKPGGGGRPGGGGGSRRLVEASRPIRDTWAWARAIAAKFGLTISSSYRTPARNRAVGGVPNSWHIRGSARRPEAFDFSGSAQARARAQGWFRKFTHPDETLIHDAGSGMHLHVGGLYRRGGWIGGVRPVRLRTGTGSVGGPVQVGRVIHQETTGPGIPSYGKRLQDALAKALTWQAGTFERLNQTVQRSAEAKLGALRNRLQAAVRKGGTEAAVKRLQAALDLVDKELGRRAGLLARRVTQRAASADRAQARSEIGLRLAGTDPESAPGLAARLRVEAAKGRGLHRTARDLGGELRLAQRAHDLERVSDLRSQIADNQTAILDSRATQRELARARQQALRDARTAFAAAMTDIASSRVQLSQTGLQRVELEQRLAGTYDTGGRQRADYITQSVIPQLQAERDQIKAQGVEAMRQNNAELARALRQAWEEKGNDILQALLDVKDATSQTATNTDPLRSLGGQLSFEFGGSRLTDDLLASSVGA